jgi:uncharacterized membrane protein
MMIVLRLLHILCGVFWAGAMLFVAAFLLPAVRDGGPGAGQVMGRIMARRYPQAIALAAILTVLTGLFMYWHDASISAGAFARSRSGMTYGLGGIAALVALVIGAAVVGPAALRLGKLGAEVQTRGGPPSPEQASTLAAAQRRIGLGTNLAALFVAIAVLCMAVARYL